MSGPPETTPSAAPGQPSDPWTPGPRTAATSHDDRPAPGPYATGPVAEPYGTAGPYGTGETNEPYGTGQLYGSGETAESYGTAGPYGGPGIVSAPGAGGVAYPSPDVSAPAKPRIRLWPPTRRERTTAIAAIVALAAVGAAVAPLWVQVAPRLAFRVDQPGRALPVVPEAEEYIAADGRFVLITLVVGVLAGLGCWLVRRSRGPWALLALAAGGLLGAVLTWQLGTRIGTGYQPADLQVVGKVIYQPLRLRAKAALVVEPVAAVIGYLLAVGFSSRNDLGRDEEGPGRGEPGGQGREDRAG